MREVLIISALLLLGSCDRSAAVTSHRSTQTHASMSDPFNCAGLPICAEEVRKLSQAEASLESEYGGAIEHIRSCEPANSTRCYDLPRAVELVEIEQMTWRAWRDAHCDRFVFGMEGTSAEGELRADCRIRETAMRIAELKGIRND